MKIMLKIWVFFGALVPVIISQSTYDSDHLTQDTYHDSDEQSYHPTSRRHQHLQSYEPTSYEEEPSRDPKHYQSLEASYHKHEPERYAHAPRYQVEPQQVQYHQPEDPSYHRPQEIVYHQPHEYYPEVVPQHQRSYGRPTHYPQPKEEEPKYTAEEPKYAVDEPKYAVHEPKYASHEPKYEVHEPKYEVHEPKYAVHEPKHTVDEPKYAVHEPKYAVHEPKYAVEEPKYAVDEPKYTREEPKYAQQPRPSHSRHPGPVPTDPKLPLYFTMYEKRVIQDPVDKYGKGPWRYLTYGHGITYGSKEPGKVFEKGYGYIRALGRDHCKLPEHLCPPRDEKPFDYEGRKEPYFGYRPH